MTRRQRWLTNGVFLFATGTGGLWAIVWHFVRKEPDMAIPWENRIMQLHLAGALALLLVVGGAVPQHAAKSWQAKTNRMPGALLYGTLAAVVVTGYGILAFSWESPETIHWLHIGAGISLLIALPLHIVLGRRAEHLRRANHEKNEKHA